MYLICTFLHSDIQKFFGDEYYGENEEQKPQFDDDDDLAGSITLKKKHLFSFGITEIPYYCF